MLYAHAPTVTYDTVLNVLYGINTNVVVTTGNEEFKTLMMETYPLLNIN